MSFPRLPIDTVFRKLQTGPDGLDPAEVDQRRTRHGYNELQAAASVNPLRIFLDQFKSFIIYILLFAVVFATLIGEYVDTVVILVILLANALIGFFQELSAHKSLEALKKVSTTHATVERAGRRQRIAARELVPGDILLLAAGDKVPADARIVDAVQLRVEESALTGESIPVDKHNRPLGADLALGDQRNMLFAATSIVNGNGRAVVVATGMQTELGRIAHLVATATEEMTPLQRRLDRFGRKLGYAIIAICLIVLTLHVAKAVLAGQLSTETFLAIVLIAISLAVAAVPTALPAVVTIALSVGVKRLLVKKALVRKLAAVETLGSCDVICTDKTGTLTANQMTVRHGWTLDGETTLDGIGYQPHGAVTGPAMDELFVCGLLCNNAVLSEEAGDWRILGDPTEAALLVSAAKAGIADGRARKDEVPFDSRRKLMSVLVHDDHGEVLYSKGAPGELLACCRRVLVDGRETELTAGLRQTIEEQNAAYAARALRVLGFARKLMSDGDRFNEEDLCFIGLQAMIDPPRPDVIDAIARTRQAGIRVIMITGDYGVTATAIGREIGIEGTAVSGPELEKMEAPQLRRALSAGANIFSRVDPEHKQRIVAMLQEMGCTVAMTGDGINDAPALKKANIGIAVGSGTDVAKEAADFVLLDDSFSHIVNAIEEGRGIYDNIQKSIMLLLSGNLGEVLIIFLAALCGMNLPLTAVLLLWINMVTDGAPALAYSVDPYGRAIMQRPPKPRAEGILPLPKLCLLGVLGGFGTLLALGLFGLAGGASSQPQSLVYAQTMVFNFVVLYEVILTFVIRHSYRVPLFSNGWVWAAAALAIGLQALLMYTPLAQVFKIVPLSPTDLAGLAAAGLLFTAGSLAYLALAARRQTG
ncbi:MAG: cation-translocating P-type ATPase [Desulfuromonadales bacterium]|nr:cation-translocating P-type ATPase [Desulfuromonadales bacterium]